MMGLDHTTINLHGENPKHRMFFIYMVHYIFIKSLMVQYANPIMMEDI